MNTALALMAKAFKLNYSTPTNNNKRISSNPQNRQIAQPVQNSGVQNVENQNGVIVVPGIAYQNGNGNVVAARAEGNAIRNKGNQIRCYSCRGLGHLATNCTVRPRRRDAAYLQTRLLIAQKEEVGIQLQAKEFDLMAAAADLNEIKEVNANCILMANLQQLSTLGTQTDKAPVYDSDGSAEYTELLEPIPEPHKVPQNDINVIPEVSSMEQGGGTVEQHPTHVEEKHVLYDSLYNNLATEVEKVNSVNRKQRETNANLTTVLARYKNQESSGKQITTLNEEISNLNKQLSKEKSTVSSLQEEKKRLKSDFKIREDELLDKHIDLENKIKELDNIMVKTGQSIQTMHMLLPKPDSFYHSKHKTDLGYQNPFYLKQAQQKHQSLYNGKFLLEKHDPPSVYDSEEILKLAQETKFYRDFQSLAKEADKSLAKHKALELKIERLLRAVVSQDIMSIVQDNSVVDTLNLQTELEHTIDSLPQKLENENVELEFQTHTKAIINSFQNKLHDTIYENAKLRAQLFDKVFEQKDTIRGTSANTEFAKQSILRIPPYSSRPILYAVTPLPKSTAIPKVGETNALSNQVTSNSVPSSQELKVMENNNVIAPRMFRIDPRKTSRKDNFMPNKPTKTSVRTNSIIVSQSHIIIKKAVNSDSKGFSSTGVDITTKTRRP
nr:hypothetical protein [Tanacetum cinerariifolium]